MVQEARLILKIVVFSSTTCQKKEVFYVFAMLLLNIHSRISQACWLPKEGVSKQRIVLSKYWKKTPIKY